MFLSIDIFLFFFSFIFSSFLAGNNFCNCWHILTHSIGKQSSTHFKPVRMSKKNTAEFEPARTADSNSTILRLRRNHAQFFPTNWWIRLIILLTRTTELWSQRSIYFCEEKCLSYVPWRIFVWEKTQSVSTHKIQNKLFYCWKLWN